MGLQSKENFMFYTVCSMFKAINLEGMRVISINIFFAGKLSEMLVTLAQSG